MNFMVTNMLKPLLCIVIVLSSTMIGFYYSHRLYTRKITLQKFINELKSSVTHIRYNSDNLCDIFADRFVGFTFSEDEPFLSQWMGLLKKYNSKLNKDDITLLLSFAENLGKSDVNGEISHIQMYIEMLNDSVEDAKNNINSKSKLYRTFGISIGLLISILLL